MDHNELEFEFSENQMLSAAGSLLLKSDRFTKNDYRFICQNIVQFENRCQDAGYLQSEINDASFFICAFLDEKISWDSDKTLVSTFCRTDTNKTDEFLERLERRQPDAKKHIDLLELAYFCLSLGASLDSDSSSSLRLSNKVMTMMDNIYDLIRDIRNEEPQALLVSHESQNQERPWYYPPIWVSIGIAIGISILIFMPYNKKLNQYTKPALNTLENVMQMDNRQDDQKNQI